MAQRSTHIFSYHKTKPGAICIKNFQKGYKFRPRKRAISQRKKQQLVRIYEKHLGLGRVRYVMSYFRTRPGCRVKLFKNICFLSVFIFEMQHAATHFIPLKKNFKHHLFVILSNFMTNIYRAHKLTLTSNSHRFKRKFKTPREIFYGKLLKSANNLYNISTS